MFRIKKTKSQFTRQPFNRYHPPVKLTWIKAQLRGACYGSVATGGTKAQAMRSQGGTLSLGLQDIRLDRDFVRMHPGTAPGRYMVLTVEDTGHGIPADMIDRIFFPFFTTKEQGEGTGLGLSVVDGVVKKHGGAITVESQPDGGSCFRVYLPIIDDRALEAHVDDSQPLKGAVKKSSLSTMSPFKPIWLRACWNPWDTVSFR